MTSYITIDLDLIERRFEVMDKPRDVDDLELMKYLFNLNYVCKSTRCRVCKTRKGLHVYIPVAKYSFENAIPLRLLCGDDPIRVEIDIKRYRIGLKEYIETLFKAKKSKDGLSVEKCIDWSTFFNAFISHV